MQKNEKNCELKNSHKMKTLKKHHAMESQSTSKTITSSKDVISIMQQNVYENVF